MSQDKIFALLGNNYNIEFITECFLREKDNSFVKKKDTMNRNGLNNVHLQRVFGSYSNRILVLKDIVLIFSGEIYNYRKLYEYMQITSEDIHTEYSGEVIIHLYKKYGMEQTLRIMDGIFAFVLCDYDLSKSICKLYIARDILGVCPLYVMESSDPTMIGFASEKKLLVNIQDKNHYSINHFQPGTYSKYTRSYKVHSNWMVERKTYPYYSLGFCMSIPKSSLDGNTYFYLYQSIIKRIPENAKTIGCILSSDIGSYFIAFLLDIYCNENDILLETFRVMETNHLDMNPMKQSIMNHLISNAKHTDIFISHQDIANESSHIINIVEDNILEDNILEEKNSSKISSFTEYYFLAKYISENTNIEAVFAGIGYNELFNFDRIEYNDGDKIEYDKKRRTLLETIHLQDLLYYEKCLCFYELQPKLPFLDKGWIDFYFRIPLEERYQDKSSWFESLYQDIKSMI